MKKTMILLAVLTLIASVAQASTITCTLSSDRVGEIFKVTKEVPANESRYSQEAELKQSIVVTDEAALIAYPALRGKTLSLTVEAKVNPGELPSFNMLRLQNGVIGSDAIYLYTDLFGSNLLNNKNEQIKVGGLVAGSKYPVRLDCEVE